MTKVEGFMASHQRCDWRRTSIPSSSYGGAGAKRRRADHRIHAETTRPRASGSRRAVLRDLAEPVRALQCSGMDPRISPDDEGRGRFRQCP